MGLDKMGFVRDLMRDLVQVGMQSLPGLHAKDSHSAIILLGSTGRRPTNLSPLSRV